jgi:hypothetical protein
MNWQVAIEKNLEALRRILALLVAMASITGDAASGDLPVTLPRHLHRYLRSLVRPAEAAARRLIIIAARGLVVTLPAPRPRKPKPVPEPKTILVLDYVNGSIVSVPVVMPLPPADPAPPRPARRPCAPALPLLDPLKRFDTGRQYRRAAANPSITLLGDPSFPYSRPCEPNLPSEDDPLDARRLNRRLEAIGRVLDDLPGQALRMARWQARRDARLEAERETTSPPSQSTAQIRRRYHRFSPMRPGRPPGWRRKPSHDVHEVLDELHGLAIWLRERPDTS